MKKILILLACLTAIIFIISSCDQQKALDKLTARQEIAEQLLTRMWEKPEMKAKIQEMLMQDPGTVSKMMDMVLQDSTLCMSMVDKMGGDVAVKSKIMAKTKEWEKAAKTKSKR